MVQKRGDHTNRAVVGLNLRWHQHGIIREIVQISSEQFCGTARPEDLGGKA